MRVDVTAEIVGRFLRYCPTTGKLFWRERKPEDFVSGRKSGKIGACKSWNTRYAGREAFNRKGENGYLYGSILNQVFLAHRIIWLLVTGSWPLELDHINGDRCDNRWENLREVDRLENSKNKSINANNTSGTMGVYYDKRRSYWYSRIMVGYKNINLGAYANKNDAIEARKAAEIKWAFHENHGRDAA